MTRLICFVLVVITFWSRANNAPNTACSRRVGVCRIYKPLSTFGLVHISNSVLARPITTNANRWAAIAQQKEGNMADVTYGDDSRHIHVMIGEYTLCGMAWDEIDVEPSRPMPITCHDCVSNLDALQKIYAAQHRLHQTAGGRGSKKSKLVVPAAGNA